MRDRVIVYLLFVFFVASVGCNRTNHSLDTAARLEEHGEHAKALAIYQEQFSKANSTDRKLQSQLLTRIGGCLTSLSRIPEAYGAYLQALEIDPENKQAHYRLGEIYLLAGEMERANEEASYLLKNADNSADAFAILGSAAEASGKEAEAREAF